MVKDSKKKLTRFEALKGLIRYNGKYLITISSKERSFVGGRYEVPGGRKISPKESDREALEREVMEEVGLKVKTVRLLNSWSVKLPTKGMQLDGKTYLAETDSDKVSLNDHEVRYYRWVTLEKLKTLDIPKWLKNAVSKIE